MLKKLPVVGVMGSSKDPWDELARPLGAALAALDVHLLTGGGKGVMQAVSQSYSSVESRKGLCIGCLPTDPQPDHGFKLREGFPNPFVEVPIITPLGIYDGTDPYQLSRNFVNIMSADAVVALPGNGGTRNEIGIALRLGTPICLLGPHDLPPEFQRPADCFDTVDAALLWVTQQLSQKEAS